MNIIHDIQAARFSGVVLTIGNFDGVHRGHQAILNTARRHADRANTQLVVMTFYPHPAAILDPSHAPETLTLLEEKLQLLERAGADTVFVLHSEPELLKIEADDFIRDIIVGRFNPVAVVEGASFGFGRRRQGDVNTLKEAAEEYGFQVDVVEPVSIILGGHTNTVVSSSLIRHLLSSGAVQDAAECLGRPYRLLGRVEKGLGRGSKHGIPTANLQVGSQMIPAEGVYAGQTFIDGQCYPAALSIGRTPTFGGERLLVEAHLLDYHEDIYDQTLAVEFLKWLREQEKYDTVEELYKQIELDITDTRRIFQKHQVKDRGMEN
jgi:riboflavin kinase/FMN adenylyltransferase